MKTLLITIALIYLSAACNAQCPDFITNKKLEKGMFIYTDPGTTAGTKYVAQILSVNGSDFTCRFLHSNSTYSFTDFKKAAVGSSATMQATVKSSKGGGFLPGTIFKMNVYMADPDRCDVTDASEAQPYFVIGTFIADNKSYLGRLAPEEEGYKIAFFHSKNLYILDEKFKVKKVNGGGYNVGSQLVIVHARTLQF